MTAQRCAMERFDTLDTSLAGPRQRRLAAWLCGLAVLASAIMLPVVARPIPAMPGFVAFSQTALLLAYALTTALFFVQFVQGGGLPVLVLGAGSLFTAGICLLQLLCFPNVFAPGLLMGQGGDTLTWLWTFWHVGPPLAAIAYAILAGRPGVPSVPRAAAPRAAAMAAAGALLLAAVAGLLTVKWVQVLPKSVQGDDYWLLTTSGIGPALAVFTLLALVLLYRATRLRTVMQLWLAVSLLLLLLDNAVTDLGAARATVGWAGGRVLALFSAVSVLAVYLMELDALRRRAELARQQAQSARDSLDLALEAGGMGDWEMDLVTGTARRTLRHDQIFGHPVLLPSWSKDDMLAHVLPEDRPAVEAAFARALLEGRLDFECRIRRASDGLVRWVMATGRTFEDAEGRPVKLAGCVMDTTERRLTEERLRQAERMESVGQLTGGVAHDFNNLLTVVIGSLEMIKRSPGDPARVERFAAGALTAAQRGAEVTSKLLAFSRRQVVRPETLNVNRLLQDFQPLLLRAGQGRIRLALDLDPALEPCRVDPRQFEAALLNLVANARDAMPSGGDVRIATRNVTLTQAQAAALEVQPGEYLRISVTDTGFGMDSATVRAAFEPFFTTKDVGRGTGLGLSQVYGFARQAQGAAQIDSAVGQGATITLLLPRCFEHAPAVVPAETSPLRRAARGEVVLVVEDEEAVLELAVEHLRHLGYKTLTAASATVALERLRSPERIDVLFSDVIMPGGMNGVQLACAARAIRDTIKVVLTSGYTAQALDLDQEMPAGTPLIGKPYAADELGETLEAILRPALIG